MPVPAWWSQRRRSYEGLQGSKNPRTCRSWAWGSHRRSRVVPSHRAVVVVLQWCAEAKALVVAPVELVLVAVVIRGSLAVELGSTVTNRGSPAYAVEGVVIDEEDRLSCV